MTLAERERCQILVLGTGVAGLAAALGAAERGAEVLVVCRSLDPAATNTAWAQGGIVFRGEGDSPELLARDIFAAGAEYGLQAAADFLATEGPRAVTECLVDRLRVPFDRCATGGLDLALEAAHSLPRILHAADRTGAAIQDALLAAARQHPRIRIVPGYQAVDLLTTHHHSRRAVDRYALRNRCVGAYLLDVATGRVCTVTSAATIIATGGAGALYVHTSNQPSCIGSGVAMASRAGARLLNLEFIQFHPTCLYVPGAPRYLVTEALRGAGAQLVNTGGERFIERYHPMGPLAPRDVVTRAIIDEMHRSGAECVYLDLGSEGEQLEGPVPDRQRDLQPLRHRHGLRPHPGRAGRPLHLRRHRLRPARARHHPGPLRRRRGGVHRRARRQPARLDIAPRGAHLRADCGARRGRPGRRVPSR